MSNGNSIGKPMIRIINRVILILLLFTHQLHAQVLDSQLKKAFNKGQFVLPDGNELQQVRKAFSQELAGQSATDIWDALSMQRVMQQDLLFFQEAVDVRKGRGLFAIRKDNKAEPWLIQAPHARFDKWTGKIVELLFSEGQFKAAMWNSVSRKTPIEHSSVKREADMAHLPETYWQAITESFARYYEQGKVIQIHGYNQAKRKSSAGRNSEIILSAGHIYPPVWVQKFAHCLNKVIPDKISLYPYDVEELGATTNVQGQLLRNIGFKGFLHIEMSQSMRQQFLQRQELRQLLIGCIK